MVVSLDQCPTPPLNALHEDLLGIHGAILRQVGAGKRERGRLPRHERLGGRANGALDEFSA